MIVQRLIKATAIFFILHGSVTAADHVVYEGDAGPGQGKHILFIASDHEYRGEETCPAIARIMAKRYGFKCTVLFGQNNGLIKQGSSEIPGASGPSGSPRSPESSADVGASGSPVTSFPAATGSAGLELAPLSLEPPPPPPHAVMPKKISRMVRNRLTRYVMTPSLALNSRTDFPDKSS